MKTLALKSVAILVVIVLLSSAYAAEYLYFRGYIDQEKRKNSEPQINAWNLKTDKLTSLDFEGYLIESEEGQIWAVIGEQGIECEKVELAFCSQGIVQNILQFNLPEKALRILAYKGGWLYYASKGENDKGCICRINDSGDRQAYNIENYISGYNSLYDMPFSISEDGYLAFIYDASADDAFFESVYSLGLSQPGGKTISVGEVGGIALAWLDPERLLYTNFEDMLYVCSLREKTLTPYLTKEHQTVSLTSPQTSISVSTDGKWIGYQEYNPPKLFGILPAIDTNWNSLILRSLESSEIRSSQPVLISTEFSYNYCPQLCFE